MDIIKAALKTFSIWLCLVMTAGSPALAQVLQAEQIVASLAPGAAGPVVTALKSQNALVLDAQNQIPTAFDLPSINLQVSFDGDSHILTAQGMVALRSLAGALADERLNGQVFQVAGHFVPEKNTGQALNISALRAQVVAEHLNIYYGIPSSRLVPVGYGANAPANPTVLASPMNTRIQIINLMSQ